MKIIEFLVFIIILDFTITDKAKVQEFLKTKIEKVADSISKEIEVLFANRCNSLCSCSWNSCDIAFPLFCNSRWKTESCKNCGRLLSLDHSVVHLSNRFYNLTLNNQNVREIICATSSLDNLVRKYMEEEEMFVWIYFGSYTGAFRNFPANYFCPKWDCRYRPWYVSAATGTKDVIFLIDSSSFITVDKFKILTTIVSFILSSLTFNDYVGLVNIGNNELEFSPYLLRANSAGTKYIANFLKELIPKGEANYEKSINKVYDILDRSYDSERSSKCNTIILMITSSIPSEGLTSNVDLYNLILQRERIADDDNKKPFYFTYTLNDLPVDKNFPYYLACNKDGIYEHIDVYNYYPSFISYFFTLGLFTKESKIIYAEPYIDSFGAGLVTTASISVYDRSTEDQFRIGVVGIDLTINDLLKIGGIDEIYLSFQEIGRSSCNFFSLSQCQIESLRPDKYKCKNMDTVSKKNFDGCESFIKGAKTCNNISEDNVFCKGKIDINANPDEFTCCSSNICINYIAVFSSLGILILLISLIIIFILRKYYIDKWNNICCNKCKKKVEKRISIKEYIFQNILKSNLNISSENK